MNMPRKLLHVLLINLAASTLALADDRLMLSANGSTLTGTDGGVGGSVGWLHNFSPDAVLGVAAEHQTIADSQWTFGSLTGSLTRGPADRRRSIYGEFHKGSGDDESHDFDYQVATAGVVLPLVGKLSLQLEDKQIDIDTTRGNMPKVGLSMLWSPRVQASVSYAESVSGNLGTKLGSARLDYYGRRLHFILGGAAGRADPVVVNLQPGVEQPGRTLKQAFAGFSRLHSRTEFLMLGDYLELADTEKVTLTLSLTLHLRGGATRQ